MHIATPNFNVESPLISNLGEYDNLWTIDDVRT